MTSAAATTEAGRPAWRDGKRYAWLLGVLVPALPFIVYGLVQLTGWSVSLVKVRAFRARAEMRKCLATMAREKYL